jgi:peptide/nickel transport system substrate-binding protein
VPKKYVEKVGDDGFKKAPIGAGPYKVVSFQPGIELVMEAFDGYWRKQPNIKRLVFRSLPEETTRAAALKKGDVDIVYLLSGPVAEDVKRTPGLKLVAASPPGVFWLDFPEQFDAKSPWHDQRVRLAASHALDRQALNQAETLGFSKPTGSLLHQSLEFSKSFPPHAYDVARAKKLLAEAGYPNGFDAGDLTPLPPYTSLGEAVAGYLGTIGIRARVRSMERATFLASWREKKLHGLLIGATGAAGNAAARIEPFVTKDGIYAYGSDPELDGMFQRQAKELDRKKREALLHQLQKAALDRVLVAPIFQQGFLCAVGARVAEAGLGPIQGYPYAAPAEDLKLK